MKRGEGRAAEARGVSGRTRELRIVWEIGGVKLVESLGSGRERGRKGRRG